jgi:Protein of unknown function (DUF742)
MTHPDDGPAYQGSLARPFMIVGGRTAPAGRDLDIATLLFTTDQGLEQVHDLFNEDRAIALLCRTVQSIAEVAAHMRLPLGVVRVLVGDLAMRGVVSIQPPPPPSESPDHDLLEKVLSGLREL